MTKGGTNLGGRSIVSLIDSIRASQRHQERVRAAELERKAKAADRADKLADTTIMNVLYKAQIGQKAPQIAREANMKVQKVYNVMHRYELLKNDDGSFWYVKKD